MIVVVGVTVSVLVTTTVRVHPPSKEQETSLSPAHVHTSQLDVTVSYRMPTLVVFVGMTVKAHELPGSADVVEGANVDPEHTQYTKRKSQEPHDCRAGLER